MRIKMKHFWGILISLSMVIGLIPSAGTVLQVEAATSVGDLTALKNALANGGEVSLWRSISGSTTNIYLEKETTLDLNNYKLTLNGSIDPKASFTIKNGTFEGSSTSQAPLQVTNGKTTIDNVTISNDYRAISNANPGSVEILSGTINGPINNSSNGGTFTISGGTINNYIRNAGKNLIISDGEINGVIKQEFEYSGGSLTISGGTINDNITIKNNTTPTVTITGGRFKVFDPTPYVPQGYTVTIEGDYKVVGPAYTALDTNGSTTPVTIAISNSHTTPQIGDTLTASCDASNLIYQWYRGDVVIEGATSTTYTVTTADVGSTIKVVVKQTKQSNGSDYASGSEPTKESAATAAVIKNTAATPSLNDASTNAGISYVTETVVPDVNYEVSSSNSEYVAVSSLTSILDGEGTPTIYVRTKETNDTQASNWVEVPLTARPAAPTGLGSTNATNGATADGTITNAGTTMEYSANGTSWTDVAGETITGLNSGTYSVRVKATDSAPHGVAATVTVVSNYVALTEANKPTISVSDSHNPPVVDDTLTASTTATDIVYEWYRDGVKIPSATASTYTLTTDDVGKAITVKGTQNKQADGTDYAEGSRPTQTSDATATVVKKTGPSAPSNAAAAGFVINYDEETFAVSTTYEVSTTQSDTGVITDGSLTSAIDSADHKVYIRAKETDDTQAGAWLEVTLSSRPDAPTGLTTENATNSSTADGKIKSTTDLMEYSSDNGTTWINATATETAVTPGTYLVRVKATSTSFRSAETEVTVGSKEIILADNQKPTAKVGLTYTGSEQVLLNAPTGTLPTGAVGMQYALGTDATTVPTDGWSTSIPIATNAKTYYVWYRVVCDDNHNSINPVNVTTTINPAGVTLTANSGTEEYTGEEKTVTGYTSSVEGLTFADSVTASGKGANVGTYDVTFAGVALNETKDTTGNYVITETINGRLTINKAASFVTKAPVARDLTYTGAVQELVTEGEADGGTLQYAIGTATEATEPYSTTIPAKINAGTYHVWYKVIGDANHTDSEATCVTATIEGKSIADATVTLDNSSLKYTGSELTVSVSSVKVGDTILNAETDYEVSGTTKATEAGNYTVKVTGKGNYKDTASAEWTILGKISHIVTFKVVNGSWDDGTNTDKIETLEGYEGDELKLSEDQIPAAGSKPSDGYKSGSWDVTPGTETEITESTTYTYTYDKEDAHTHNIVFAANGATITGSCANEGCTLENVKLTIVAPTLTTVGGTGSEKATLTQTGLTIDFIKAYGNNVSDDMTVEKAMGILEASIQYEGIGDTTYNKNSVAPKEAGTYKASFTIAVGATATVEYEIKEANKTAAVVTKAPEAKNLTYTGSAQELVNAGTASGGTMYYVLGTDATTTPADNLYTTSIPTGTDAGTYYVWYKAKGDSDHTDSAAAVVTATIKGGQTEAKIETKVEEKEDTPTTTVEGLTKDVVVGVATDEEKTAINNGEKAVMSLEITNIDQSVSAADKQIMEGAASAIAPNAQVGLYLDFSMFLKVGNRAARKVTELQGRSVSVKVSVPAKLKAPAGVKRIFYLLSIHNNISKILGSSTTDTIPATLTEFSTYAIAYADELPSEQFFTSIKVKQTNGKIKISWDKTDAKKVEVYMTYCGKQYTSKPVKTTSGTSVTIKKLNGKKINFKKNFKLYLVGYGSSGSRIGKTVSAHFAGKDNKKYTNVKLIKVKNESVTLTKGQSTRISASVKLEDKKKKMLNDDHAAKFRYASTNAAVATVDKDGNITGVSAGTCYVYVYAVNGLAHKIAVTVTE